MTRSLVSRPARADRSAPAARVTVTSLPSLDPVRADALAPFWDTLFRVAQRVALGTPATVTPAAA